MSEYLDHLIAFVSANAWLAYLTVFLAALLEAVPVFGSLIPGSTIIFALSALVGEGRLDLLGVLGSAFTGAVIGDGTAYLVGWKGQRRMLEAWPLSRYPDFVAKGEHFFRRFGTLAVFFARFVPPVRAFVPIIAGALGMSPLKFFAVNFPAILLWALAHIVPAALAATAIQEAEAHGSPGMMHSFWLSIGVTLAIALAGSVWWRRRRRLAAEPAEPL